MLKPSRRRVAHRPRLDDLERRSLLNADAGSALHTFAAQVGTANGAGASNSLLDALNSASAIRGSSQTSASNTDTLPDGVATVPRGFLVAYNGDASGQAGAGSTIVRINRDGSQTPFFQGSDPLGLTGLGVLRAGFVFAAASGGQVGGSLLVLDHNGRTLADIHGKKWLNEPSAIAVHDMGDHAQIFVANAGDGSVVRLDVAIEDGKPRIVGGARVATGFAAGSAAGASRSGLAYDPGNDVLYVSSSADNAVFAVANAGQRNSAVDRGTVVVQGGTVLNAPTGLAVTPTGKLLVVGTSADGTSGLVAEFTPRGTLVSTMDLGTSPGAFAGLALKVRDSGAALAVANDATDTIDLAQIGPRRASRTSGG
jgi:DNA-binding beta-propeller fold protein YncE